MKLNKMSIDDSMVFYINQFLQPLEGHDIPVLFLPEEIDADPRYTEEWKQAIQEGDEAHLYDIVHVSWYTDRELYENHLVFTFPEKEKEPEKEATEEPKPDMVNHPPHYQSKNSTGMECIDIIKASMSPEEFHGYLKGCIIKYIFRAGYKWDSVEDLEKGDWYLQRMIEEIKSLQ